MLKDISKELKAHAPFTMFGALFGVILIVLIVYTNVPRSVSGSGSIIASGQWAWTMA